jgi:hypothetical protein
MGIRGDGKALEIGGNIVLGPSVVYKNEPEESSTKDLRGP